MIFNDNLSFIYILLFIIIYNVSRFFIQNRNYYNILILFGSLLVIGLLTKLTSLLLIIIISVLVFYIGYYLKSIVKEKYKIILLFISISFLVVLFIFKNYNISNLALIQRVGLSYILFRWIHFLVDSYKSKIKNFNLFSFVNYIIFFPAFLAGPIDNYQNFNFWVKRKDSRYSWVLIKTGIFKIVLGVVKKYFIVPQLFIFANDFSVLHEIMNWEYAIILNLLAYSFYILFDFSGYSDIAIGTSYLIGIKIPENFDFPYLANNISIFWKKWHMTFSNFLFKYIFKPMVIGLSNLFPKSPRLLITYIGYILTFVLCGIWHGNTLNFIYWGLWHAIGLIIYKTWSNFSEKKDRHKQKNSISVSIHHLFNVLITFVFVTVGWFFFNNKTEDVHLIIKKLIVNARVDNTDAENRFKVNTVKVGDYYGFEIKYIPDFYNVKHIELKVKASDQKEWEIFKSIPVNSENGYYIIPKESQTNLFEIQARSLGSNAKSNWKSKLVYFSKEVNYTDFQKKFLENRHIKKIDQRKVLLKKLILPDSIQYQTIRVNPMFFKDYGWGINNRYVENSEYKVDIEYKLESDLVWKQYVKDRVGSFNFVHIHGSNFHDGLTRNLLPGKYFVRIRYKKGHEVSDWIENYTIIADYMKIEINE